MLTFLLKKLGLSVFFLVAVVSTATSQDISWQTDLVTANSLAAKQRKFVWLHFTADWCQPCKSLETFVFTSPLLQAAIENNVIPVKVDVDLQKELVSEYGISGVPTDVVLTPAGRVITKRNSPSTIDDYTKMFKGLSKTLAGLDHDKSGAARDLAELQEQMQPKKHAGQNDFAPPAPSHQAPRITNDGEMLAKNTSRVLENPFCESALRESPIENPRTTKNSVVIKNEFGSLRPQDSTLTPLQMSKQAAQAKNNAPVAATQQQSAFAIPPAADQPAANSGPLVANQPQSIANKFYENERVASPTANIMAEQTAQRSTSVANDQFEPPPSIEQLGATQPTKTQAEPLQIDRSKFALHGKCPVTLLTESKWVDGDLRFGCVHRGRTYLFANKKYLQLFQSDPDKYSPLLAGYDPVIYHERGELVDGLEIHGVFMGQIPNQHIVLFSSAETRAKFENHKNTKDYIETIRQAMLSTNSPGNSELR